MELKEGEYWNFKGRKNELNQEFIVTLNYHIFLGSTYFCTSKIDWNDEVNKPITVIPATNLQKQWLNACIKANKYVECPTIEENVLNSIQIW